MVVEFFLVCCGLVIGKIVFRFNHPMFLGFIVFSFFIFCRVVVSFYGGVYGFSLFIVSVSGILVVFLYSIALIPISLNENESKEVEKEVNKKKGSGGPKQFDFGKEIALMVCFIFLSLLVVSFSEFRSVEISELRFNRVLFATND